MKDSIFYDGPDERFEWERLQDKNDCIFFDKKSMADSCVRLDELVEELYTILDVENYTNFSYTASKVAQASKDKTIIRMVLWHLYLANQGHPDQYVAISLRSDTFKYCNIYNPYKICKRISPILHKMHENGLIDFHSGFMNPKTSKFTRIRSSLCLAEKLNGLPHDLTEISNAVQPIIFKNRKSKKVIGDFLDMSDNDVVDAKNTVIEYNKMMAYHRIRLKGHQHSRFFWKDSTGRNHVSHLDRRFLYSVVHVDVDVDVGASLLYFRMHGPSWQGMPKRFRQNLLIDDAETIELDYTAQILNIAASLSGIQLGQDPYNINIGLGNISYKSNKAIMKKAIVIMLNCDSESSAVKALRSSIQDDSELLDEVRSCIVNFKMTELIVSNFFKKIIENYPFLEELSFRSMGLSLFKLDAEIARRIIQRHLDADKVILPIHDGFVVKKEDEDFLLDAMRGSWAERFNTTIGVKKENSDI